MHQLKIAQQDYNEIVDYLIWMQSTPDSIKDRINMEQAERSIFGPFGYGAILTDEVDNSDLLDDYMLDHEYYITAHSIDGETLLKMSINDKIVIEFLPE